MELISCVVTFGEKWFVNRIRRLVAANIFLSVLIMKIALTSSILLEEYAHIDSLQSMAS